MNLSKCYYEFTFKVMMLRDSNLRKFCGSESSGVFFLNRVRLQATRPARRLGLVARLHSVVN